MTAAKPEHLSLMKLMSTFSHRYNRWDVFSDFVAIAAISISNAVDLAQREKREARYLEIIKRYEKQEVRDVFPRMLAELVNQLEQGPADVMGRFFHELELHNKYVGQFFTPFEVCRLMAAMTADKDHLAELIKTTGYVTVCEPACGSGAMVIAFADNMQKAGFNYQKHLHVTAVDVDLKCVHMAYLQLSLLHIPAIIVHGNSLTLEEHSHWYTPAHILGFWSNRLRRRSSETQTEPEKPIERVAAAAVGGQLTLF